MSDFPKRVKAVLGPTNTGKTHLAIERLLGHRSGIIGFPLRLLARENYDRMVARVGAKHVALITGEEKILPAEARYFSCTVEAMPLDRAVEFLAVDEIQLCADPDRGHIFTDRLLHARGMVETMFLGAETIRRLLKKLVPEAEIETRPRLSQLAYVGPAKLSRLPPRSAIVAFSAANVYEIAEAVRRRRGGCAVVMGRLSPRTRNAQVALYQEKEVDFLVATDAIGMGLNMDVDHVAFAGLSKFDGHRPRPLTAPEVAQIAGRAGRGMRNGTFGTTAECRPLEDEVVNAVESHAFEQLEQLRWRNAALDFSSTAALLESLTAVPPEPGLVKGNDAGDLVTLAALAADAEIRYAASRPAGVRLLWEACQVPDFRKLASDDHVRLCGRLFLHLEKDGKLPADWIGGHIEGVDRTEGDIDTLMQRLAEVRVWSYIAARADWLDDAAHWQGRARAVEDKLSDVLHERLMARFVDRRAAHLSRRLDEAEEDEELLSAVSTRGVVLVEGHEVGRVSGFAFTPDPATSGDEQKLVLRAARRALKTEMPRRIGRALAAADTAFTLLPGHRIGWEGAEIARLKRGAHPLKPSVEVIETEWLDAAAREELRRRLSVFLARQIELLLGPLLKADTEAETKPLLRAPSHLLGEALGVAPPLGPQDKETRTALRAAGIEPGRFALFMPALLKPKPAALRALLWALWHGAATPALPAPGLVSAPPDASWPPAFAAASGWLALGAVMIRLDVAERIARELAWFARERPVPVPGDLASRLSLKGEQVSPVLEALGFRYFAAEVLPEEAYGPPAPALLVLRRARRPEGERRGPPKGQHRRADKPQDRARAQDATRTPEGARAQEGPRKEHRRKEGGKDRTKDERNKEGGKDRAPRRPAPKPEPEFVVNADSPFAVLAALRRRA